MIRFFEDILRLIDRYRRGLFLTVAGAFVLWCVALFASYRLSTDSKFCGNCHYETPFIQSWQQSSHADVSCNKCHMPRDFGGKLNRGYAAISATLRYWTGTHDKIPRAEVDDANCLVEGCHELRLIQGKSEYIKGITFDHAHHLGQTVRGMTLHCSSCHSQIVQGAHMEVTKETCYLCHFKNLPRGEAVSGCKCHSAPEEIVMHQGFPFQHAQYLTLGVVCEECHVNVVSGNADVPKSKCMECHNARLEAYDDVEFIHRKHVEQRHVDCTSCHPPIEHGSVEMVRSLETTCESCHTSTHTPQRDLFMGIGARGVDPYPSIMFKAQVGCEGCHGKTAAMHGFGESVATPSGEMCVMCHGVGFDKMLDDWKSTVRSFLASVEPLEKQARSAYQAAGQKSRAPVQEAYERATYNLGFLREGHGEHNIVYTKLVLTKIQEDFNDVLAGLVPSWKRELPLAFNEDDIRGNCTASCHANLRATKTVRFEGLELTHRDHVYKHNLACTYCHDNSRTHGEVILKRENCLGCHHTQESRDCQDCHKKQQRMLAGTGALGLEETPSWMVDVGCRDCHPSLHGGNDRNATLQACVDCHEEGYDEMVEEWQSDTESRVKKIQLLEDAITDLLTTARSRGITAETVRQAEKLRNEGLSYVDLVKTDRSRGAHNVEFTGMLLDGAIKKLEAASELLGAAVP